MTDVTYAELNEMFRGKSKEIDLYLDAIHASWIGDIPHRETSVRVGHFTLKPDGIRFTARAPVERENADGA